MAGYFGKSVGVSRNGTKITVPTTKGYPTEKETPAEDRAEGGREEGYADGGFVANTFRSDAEKRVDQMYGNKQAQPIAGSTDRGTSNRAKQLEEATK